VALVKLGALGDAVYAFPIVSAIKAWRPAAKITWIIEERLCELPRLHPAVDEVVTVDTKAWRRAAIQGRWPTAWRGLSEFSGAVADRFDVVLDAQGLLKSGVAAWLTRAPMRVGFAPADCRERGNAWFMTRHAEPAGRVHVVTKNLGLPTVVGAAVTKPVFEIVPSRADEDWVKSWLAAQRVSTDGRLVALHPGAGHPAKRWGLTRFVALAERLGERAGRRVVLISGPEDRTAVEAAVAAMARPPVVAAPPGVGPLAALLRRCGVVVAGDTGPLHLAAALGCPTVALFGPSDPLSASPVGEGHRVIKHPCPCGWTPGPYFNRRCPDAPCMGLIEIDEVAEAVERQLTAHR
jgi:lipopolysaccharide heptosyltransferase I